MIVNTIKNVWIVDDDPLQILILNRLFSQQSEFRNTRFFSGSKAAIEALNNYKVNENELPHLVFLDLVMPRGDGWVFLDHYKKVKHKLPVVARIVVISSFNEESMNRIKQYPEVHLLSKPLYKKTFEDLMQSFTSQEDPQAHNSSN